MTNRAPHPHFDDYGTLNWYTDWASAWAAARAEKKSIFIEFGRAACGQCRGLVEAVIPRPDVAPLLQEHFIALASDCDEADPEVEDLAMKLEGATMLPFVLLADSGGQFLDGLSGNVPPAELVAFLERHKG